MVFSKEKLLLARQTNAQMLYDLWIKHNSARFILSHTCSM